ncbi:TolC family protein [Flavobacterium sp. Sd200]|uniref:TolC family protein n=1 Tax=Flavobacterium sp. Sd200 TaxID=2692211 RepID=UPI001370062D|nr:TolC family protein [Flavobacterium sp. Sd200]MXN92295.1 TolC family protein [Flavobacterium sp. Sd200]
MIKTRYKTLILFVAVVFTATAQQKKWTLQECVDYALQHNISVRQAELDLQTTAVAKKDALGAFLPSANVTGSHTWNVGLNINPLTNLLQQQTIQYSNAGASAQFDIYKGLQNQMNYRRAKMAIIAGQYQVQKMKDDTALNVANAFLEILFNKENLKVQQQQLAIDEEQGKRSSELVEGGQIPRGDLLDIEATVASDRQKVIAAENQLLLSRLSLAQLLQLEDFAAFDIADEEYDSDQSEVLLQTPQAIFDKAKDIRTEIKLALANLDMAQQDIKIARGAYQPTLRGFYSINTRISYADNVTYVTPEDGGTPVPVLTNQPSFWNQFVDNKGHAFGFQLNIPILNGLSVRNNVQRNKVALEKAKLTYEQQKVDLERNVYTAFTDAQGALRSYEAAVAAQTARAEALNYAKERYEVGLINVFDLNQAQTLSVNAQSEVLRTKYDYIFRVKILEFYFGIPLYQN